MSGRSRSPGPRGDRLPRAARTAKYPVGRGACLILGVLLNALPAAAQTESARVDVGVGLLWRGGTSFARVPATETALQNGVYTLFNSDTQLQGAAGVEARVGVRLTSLLRAEGSFSYSKPSLQTRITSDVEGIPDVTVDETITRYTIEGGVTARLARWAIGRLTPFAAAGGGYLRELHDGRGLVETGQTYYVGGGIRYPLPFAARGLVKSSGLRADVRGQFMKNGVALDDRLHTVPSASVSFVITF